MTYAHALGKGGGGHGGGGHQGGGGHHGGGHHGGWRGGGGRRWGGRGFRSGLYYGGYGPGFIDYVSYSPCDDCMYQPPSLALRCLIARGCVSPYGLGQTSTMSTGTMIGAGVLGVGFVGAGITWWLKGRRRKRKS